MAFKNYIFRILLPVLYIAFSLLGFLGLILTIAEGPNPLGFVDYYLSLPGGYLVDLLDEILTADFGKGLFGFALAIVLNLALYFLIGLLIDYTISRVRRR